MRRSGLLVAVIGIVASLAGSAPEQAVVGGRTATAARQPLDGRPRPAREPASDALFCGGALIAPPGGRDRDALPRAVSNPNGNVAGQLDVVGGALSRSDPSLQRAGWPSWCVTRLG